MGVFDGVPKVVRAVPDPMTDKILPSPNSLSYGGITSPTALGGTCGMDTMLVHGDRDRQIDGSERSRITIDRYHKVGVNQMNLVGENRTDMTTGNHNKTVIGGSNRTHVGPTNDTYVENHAIDHKSDQQLQEPVSYLHFIKEKTGKYYQKSDETHSSLFLADFFSSYVTALYTDVRTGYIMATGVSGAATGVNLHLEGVDNATRGLENKLEGIKSSIEAIQPEVSITMLHEVALTQKIIIVGVNQFM